MRNGLAYQMLSTDEFVSGEGAEPVAVEVDGGGVHGDELGDVGMTPLAAVNYVGRPVVVKSQCTQFK